MGKRRKAKKGEKIMKCGICKAEMEEKNVTYTEDICNGVIVIRHVPAQVCTECGNSWYSGTVALQLEKMIDKFIASTESEISIVNFSKAVA